MTTKTAEVEQIHGLALDTLRDGSALKLFDEELQHVIRNILDDRTDPKKARAVVINVQFVPYTNDETGEVDRESVSINIYASSKLAPVQSGEAQHRVKTRGDRYQIVMGF